MGKVVRARAAFTMTELVTAIAIVSLLSALLMPVFVSSRKASLKSSCSVRLKQTLTATQLYLAEYDDRFMPAQQDVSGRGTYLTDKRWPQLLMPYSRNEEVFRCPSDRSHLGRERVFDPDLVPLASQMRSYEQAERANFGYNALNLAPARATLTGWVSQPIAQTDLANSSQTVVFAETAWMLRGGEPVGGGNFVASPPCRFSSDRSPAIGDIPPAMGSNVGGDAAWKEVIGGPKTSATTTGGVFAFHTQAMNVGYADGSVRSQSIRHLAKGCNLQPGWNGTIQDLEGYAWDVK